ncbi:hypothetical protein JTE90_018038 [Oedothorax gibbosus]|nr:hypothetical protein JTE90_018038 [Oedothorax gibbosus]
MPVFFEVAAINLAEVFLAHNKDIDSDDARKYVDFLSSELDMANLSDYESIVQAQYNAYAKPEEAYFSVFPSNFLQTLAILKPWILPVGESRALGHPSPQSSQQRHR